MDSENITGNFIVETHSFPPFFAGKLKGTLVDTFSRAGRQDLIEEFVTNKNNLDSVLLNILIRYYGEHDMAPKATALLQSFLKENDFIPSLR